MNQLASFLLPLWLNGSISMTLSEPHAILQQESANQFVDSAVTAAVTSAVPQIKAVRISGNHLNIDGILDEEIWVTGQVVNEFWQREPKEGSPATERTEVRIFYDEDALYVGARMYSDHPEKIGASAARRDQLGFAETFIINLDCYHDRKTSYSFGVTVAGVKQDYYHPIDDEIKSRDVSFNPVWDAKVTVDSIGWSVELRIPFSQLRFNDDPIQVWGVNLNRYIPSRNEDVYWRLRRNRDTGWSSLFGDLVGIEGIRPTDRIEVLPYVAGGATLTGARDPNNPFDDGRNLTSRVGADVKMGLGPNLTIDGTVNPDFGQVEADPAVVNLTAFEIVFTERRPFFFEGNKLFSNTGQTFFYSRRIGAPPHGNVTGSYVDRPNNSTILGAAKVSGRLSSGLSLGALGAITRREYAQVLDTSAGMNSVEVEPLTGVGVVRLEQEFGPYVSTVGLILTAVRRQFSEGGSLSTLLARQAFSGGGNWNLRFQGGMYELTGDAGFSYVEGNAEAIRRVQTSSAHYFQRPDATYAMLDPTRPSLTGYGAGFGFNKLGGEHWLWGANLAVRSPGLELNDIGQLTSADDIELVVSLRYRETLPTKIFHNYNFGISAKSGWNFEKIKQLMALTFSGTVTWKNFWRTTSELSYRGRVLSDNLTRGGPLMGTGEGWNFAASVASGVTSKSKYGMGVSYGQDELGGWSYGVNISIAPRPADQWDCSVAPSYVRSLDPRQYVTSIAGGSQLTFGRRYVFSFIDRSTFSLQFRFNYNFTPDISLETYAEPFAASGRYFDFGELAAAQSRGLRIYGTDGTTVSRNTDGSLIITDGPATFAISNRDFNLRSFRSNVVLRWEWRLGSTLYLVWQQNRSSSSTHGRLVNAPALWESLTSTGDNILAVKVSYWLPVD